MVHFSDAKFTRGTNEKTMNFIAIPESQKRLFMLVTLATSYSLLTGAEELGIMHLAKR